MRVTITNEANGRQFSHTASSTLKPLVQWMTMPDLTDVCRTGKENANPASLISPECATNLPVSESTKAASVPAIKSKRSCTTKPCHQINTSPCIHVSHIPKDHIELKHHSLRLSLILTQIGVSNLTLPVPIISSGGMATSLYS